METKNGDLSHDALKMAIHSRNYGHPYRWPMIRGDSWDMIGGTPMNGYGHGRYHPSG